MYKKQSSGSLKEDLGITDSKILIHVSNFREVKRVQDIIRVFQMVHQQVDSKLLLVGDGPEMSVICELVDQLDLKEHVLFLGKQDNVQELYNISDLMLLLSEKESFGLVLLEAMACGVPCIGTNIGGIPEVIDHGETGYICELGDIEDIANHAVKLLNDTELHSQFSDACLQGVHHKFQSANIIAQYEEIYENLLSGTERNKR